MELVSFGKDVLQSIAEYAASYRLGQSVLRHFDRTLWVIEKCARWAVPPPLEQDDDRPQPELVRPLPWVFFLAMLITLRVTRESISLVNLVMGKPPLRSADVVMFIQSKRRYLRTLKYQGTRMSRARTSHAATPAPAPSTAPLRWYTSLYSLFELTMCFRKQSHYDNNNTTRVSNNDEIVVVTRNKHSHEDTSPSTSTSENTMERLIEKMMVDLDAESDEESTYTLTNISTSRTDRSELETDRDTVYFNETPTSKHNGNTSNEEINFSPNPDKDSSTPEKNINELSEDDKSETSKTESNNDNNKAENGTDDVTDSPPNTECQINRETIAPELSDKQVTQNFIQYESKASTPKKEHKIANGRTVKSVSNKKKGGHRERQRSNEVLQPRTLTSNNSF